MTENVDGPDFSSLPEGCISHVLSLASPRDACRSSAASSIFRSAAESDSVWERFLRDDYSDILSRSVSPMEYSSKKELYFRLCDSILIDGGKMSYWLDKSSGKKCFMLSAGELGIVWGDTPQYWRWVDSSESRFSKVAELLMVCWLEITGRFNSQLLSPKTTYIAYLVVKIDPEGYGLDNAPAELCVKLGDQLSVHPALLKLPSIPRRRPTVPMTGLLRWRNSYFEENWPADGRVPLDRGDGWMELELGEFYTDEGNYGEVEFSLMEVKGGDWKRGLIVDGIEIRPKKA
ncbi:F-box protein PP2-B10-like [Aristolochia californica]|uniref:F-box protein PP2-B10-like n=1 Tax=Aristolochia californica TaxID=171875 RepID=UPI0035E00B83